MSAAASPTPHGSTLAPATTRGFRGFLRLVTLLRPYRWRVAVSALLALAVTAVSLSIPRLMGLAIEDIEARSRPQLAWHVKLLLLAALIRATIWFFRRTVAGTISLGLEQHLRDRLFGHLSGLSFRFFDRQQTGQLLSRVTVDVTSVRFFLGYGLIYFYSHLMTLVGVSVMVWWINRRLALIAYTMLPLIFLVSSRYSRRSHSVLKEIQQREADVTAAAEENIVGARVVRAFGQEEREIERFRALTDRIVGKELESARISARFRPLYSLIPNLALAAVMLVSVSLVSNGSLTKGEFLTFYGYLFMLIGPVRIIGNLVSRAQRATASGERLFEILDADERLPVRTDPVPLPADGFGEIRFEGVCFAYEGDARVLEDVNLTVPAGATVALLGPTGCGKTTLASLVPRLYDPTRGRIVLDGVDLHDLSLEELRRAVGIVDQDPFLFSATVAENIGFGKEDAGPEEIRSAAEAAQALDFVEALPNGFDTLIGERGLTLSGGQRQRLAIARALVTSPRILILDDATASVDARVERQITRALAGATAGRTTILIAHRPSTIALADVVVMMDAGRIVDIGSHDELLVRNALYAQIHEQRAVHARREFLIDPALDTGGAPA